MVIGVDVGGTKVAVAAVQGVTPSHRVEHPTVTESTEALCSTGSRRPCDG